MDQTIWEPDPSNDVELGCFGDAKGLTFNPLADGAFKQGAVEQTGVLDLRAHAGLADDTLCALVSAHKADLKRLMLEDSTECTEAGLMSISHLELLIDLDVSGCAITDTWMQAVALRCRQLRRLRVSKSSLLTAVAFRSLADHLPALRYLDVRACQGIDGAALHMICSACPLIELNVASCARICEGTTQWACKLPQVEVLTLSGSPIDDQVLHLIATHSRRLASLNLCRCTLVQDPAVAAIVTKCTSLTVLLLAGCFAIGDAALANIAAPAIVELNLAGCQGVSDEGVGHIAKQLRKLQVLSLAGTTASDTAILQVASSCPGLQIFDAKGCPGIGDAAVCALAEHCHSLVRMDVRGCAIISVSSLHFIEQAAPACHAFVNQHAKSIY